MRLKRKISERLGKWAEKPAVPLVLTGAPGTGKTSLFEELGTGLFDGRARFFDCGADTELRSVFEDGNAEKLEKFLVRSGAGRKGEKQFFLFDNFGIGEKPLSALKKAALAVPGTALAAAGRGEVSGVFPSEGIEVLKLAPLTFREFLMNAAPMLEKSAFGFPVSDSGIGIIIPALNHEYVRYQASGGMPAAVSMLLEGRCFAEIDEKLKFFLSLWREEAEREAHTAERRRIGEILKSVPAQLSSGNSKFFIARAAAGAKNREYAPAIGRLCRSGVLVRVGRFGGNGFKLCLPDTGILRVLAGLSSEVVLNRSPHFREIRRMFRENGAAAVFSRQPGALSYWTKPSQQNPAFVLEVSGEMIPAEAETETGSPGKILSLFRKRWSSPFAIRLTEEELSFDGQLLSVPFALSDRVFEFAEEALKRGKAGF